MEKAIKCYDCKAYSVPYSLAIKGEQISKCSLCGNGYLIRVYSDERVYVLGRIKNG